MKLFTKIAVVLRAACFVAIFAPLPSAADTDFRLDKDRANQISVREESGEFFLETLGIDPYIYAESKKQSSKKDFMLEFEYFCPQGVEGAELFTEPASPQSRIILGSLPDTQCWRKAVFNMSEKTFGKFCESGKRGFRLDFGRKSGVKIGIRNIKLRPPDAEEKADMLKSQEIRKNIISHDAAIEGRFREKFPARIEKVKILPDSIEISIKAASLPKSARLVRLNFYDEAYFGFPAAPQSYSLPDSASGEISVRLKRFSEGGEDLILSKWLVADLSGGYKALSHLAYPSDFSAIQKHISPPPKAGSIKGMGAADFPRMEIFGELSELGVCHITSNVLVNGLFARPWEKEIIERKFCGRTYKFSAAIVKHYDKTYRYFLEHKIKVSAILLVNFDRSSDCARLIIHPRAKPDGAYAMPNLQDKEGFLAYAAAIDFLADRYAGDNPETGRIDNYIIHNEVDYASDWTNMGEPPMHVYLAEYIKSMRLTEILARSRNPHARVFISLTHGFKKAEPDPSWRTYSVKEILDFLALSTAAEGDFEWGLAYHPYPLNLFKADTWNDDKSLCRFDFSTPYITPKNIDVIFEYMKRPEFLSGGKPRRIIFSEQGFNSEYDDISQNTQSAAMLYMWEKMKNRDNLEAFHYHNWCDNAMEGGLKIGLRTLPKEGKPFGERKKAWYVYKALGTETEAAGCKNAAQFLGEKNIREAKSRPAVRASQK